MAKVPAWDGRIHFDGRHADQFRKDFAVMAKKGDDMQPADLLDYRIVLGFVVLGALVIAGWFSWNNGRAQLFDLDKNTGRPYQPERIDLLQHRAARRQQEQEKLR